jgi:hypothetical protein
MALLKMGTAARRAGAGSTKTIRRALVDAGIPLVEPEPGVWSVEEADLERFLRERPDRSAEPAKKPAKKKTPKPDNRRK